MGEARVVGGCGPWATPRAVELSNEILRRFLQGREVNDTEGILQLVVTKQGKDEYKIAAMGLAENGMGQTLGTAYGSKGETLATLAALVRLMEVAE